MIGMNNLGKSGRLGNQMFQFAALVGIAKSNNLDYVIPDHSMFNEPGGYRYHELQHCFEMGGVKYGEVYGGSLNVSAYHFDERVMKNCPDNVSLSGYFESEKYFEHVKTEIRLLFTFKKHIREACEMYGKFLERNPVGVVVRRGDFLFQQSHHPVCEIEYYEKSLDFFEGRSIMIFSDDMEWCKKQKCFTDRDHFFVENSTEVPKGHFDLCLLSMCNDFIIANSTFAWWGAWLSRNKEKKVIAPSRWFGPALSMLNTKDQIPSAWKRV